MWTKKKAQTSCVSGIPDGIQFHEGETIADAITCFCAEELCNTKDFCNDCTVGSGKDGLVSGLLIGLILMFIVSDLGNTQNSESFEIQL